MNPGGNSGATQLENRHQGLEAKRSKMDKASELVIGERSMVPGLGPGKN